MKHTPLFIHYLYWAQGNMKNIQEIGNSINFASKINSFQLNLQKSALKTGFLRAPLFTQKLQISHVKSLSLKH